MTRRGFFGGLAAAVAAAVTVPKVLLGRPHRRDDKGRQGVIVGTHIPSWSQWRYQTLSPGDRIMTVSLPGHDGRIQGEFRDLPMRPGDRLRVTYSC